MGDETMMRGVVALALTMVIGVPVAEEAITALLRMQRYAVADMWLGVRVAIGLGQPSE